MIIYSREDGYASEYVQTLSDFLHSCGVDCDIDQYHASEDILDWEQWWEQKINGVIFNNGYVLFAVANHDCLKRCLAKSEKIYMNAGFMSSILLSSYITDASKTGYFIPVYLDAVNISLLPGVLSQRTSYCANVRALENVNPNASSAEILDTRGLESLRSLVFRLTGQVEVEKPMVAHVPPPRKLLSMFRNLYY